jgi:hypothetical protein
MSQPWMTDPAISIPWGEHDRLELAVPAGWPAAQVVWPDLSGAVDDYPAALTRALGAPRGCPRLEDQVRAGVRVALVVDDPSRWTPVREALPPILDRLHEAGVRANDVTVSVGVGRHRVVDDDAMRRRLGNAVVERYRCFSPPLDDLSAYVDLGTTPQGVPVRVFRPVAEADVRVLVGSVLPHLQAGFGGGSKLIFPGTSHRSTLSALHRQGIGPDAGRRLGGADNPMRRAIGAAAGRIGPCVSVSHLIGPPGTVLQVVVGHPDVVQNVLSAEARQRFAAPVSGPADLIVAGNHPWPGDPLMSFKVLLQHRSACRKGGVLAGFFWTDPGEIDRSLPLPWLRAIAATGVPGGWMLRRGLVTADHVAKRLKLASAFMIHWARELVVDRTILVYAPPLFDRIGPVLGPVRLFADQAVLWRAAAEALCRRGMSHPTVRLFPLGGLTYAPASPEPEG